MKHLQELLTHNYFPAPIVRQQNMTSPAIVYRVLYQHPMPFISAEPVLQQMEAAHGEAGQLPHGITRIVPYRSDGI